MTVKFIPPRVPLVDPKTGMITREWYLLFQSLFSLGGMDDDLLPLIAPVTGDAANAAAIDELRDLIEGVPIAVQCEAECPDDIAPPHTPFDPFPDDLAPVPIVPTADTLGLGTMALQDADDVAITGGEITGIVDLLVEDGGTGASTPTAARNNLSAAKSGANSDITALTGLTTALSVAQGGTGDTGSAWTNYTPTITAGAGTLTTVSASGWYKTVGKTVVFTLDIVITTNGTGASYIIAPLPFTTARPISISGREVAAGKALASAADAGQPDLAILNYDGTYPGADARRLILTGCYERT